MKLLHHFLEKSAEKFSAKTALICEGNGFTFRELNEMANRLANAMINKGVKKQDRVAIFLENSMEAVVSIFGILKAGAIFIVINPDVKERKLKFVLNDCMVSFLITDVSRKFNFSQCSSLRTVIFTGETNFKTACFHDLLKESKSEHPDVPCIDIDLCCLIYTSGSTGDPRGSMFTHLNMITSANSIIEYLENSNNDIILNFLPLSFDYGLYNCLMPFAFGGTVVLEKKFLYPYQVTGLIKKEKVTGLPLLPTIIALLSRYDMETHMLPTLRYITSTGQAIPTNHLTRMTELFPSARIYSMYGLTECKRALYLSPEKLLERPTSVGKAIPNTEAYLIDKEGNRITKSGEVGELVVRGMNVMQGYWNLPEETSKVLKVGHHPYEKILHTGDLFKMDDEMNFYFVSRRDDLVKTAGERVSPIEIENVLYDLDDVQEAVVSGIKDEILGQALKAFVVLSENSTLTENDIIQHCSEYLEKNLVPKYIEICFELPKTLTGKICKKNLN